MSDIGYRELLETIAPGKCILCETMHGHSEGCRLDLHPPRSLVVEAPLPGNHDGWGNIGKQIVSHAIIHTWRTNGFLEQAFEDSDKVFVLTERAQLYLTGKVKETELKMPTHLVERRSSGELFPDDAADVPIEGLLFTRAGTCTLCGTKMDVFGQVSHAKSHINKGHPVFIEEVKGKKVPKITPGAKIEPPVEKPPVEQGDFRGPELFSTSGVCRLCPAGSGPVHIFGRISHAKSHIKRGDPVEIQVIHKKSVPVVTGEIMPEPSQPAQPAPTEPTKPVNTEDLTPAQQHAREEGINAILAINRAAGLPEDREEAGRNWDKMGPVSRLQTQRTAKSLETK